MTSFDLLRACAYVSSRGWYLHPERDYTLSQEDVTTLCRDVSVETSSARAKLTEAALATDNARLFECVHDAVGAGVFLPWFDDEFGLDAFASYSAVACLTFYLDGMQTTCARWDAWLEQRNHVLFNELTRDFWTYEWELPGRPRQLLAILYLLRFLGDIPPRVLLKKCLQTKLLECIAPLVALGASFEADDVYLLPECTNDEWTTVLDDGLLATLKAEGTPDMWDYLVRRLIRV